MIVHTHCDSVQHTPCDTLRDMQLQGPGGGGAEAERGIVGGGNGGVAEAEVGEMLRQRWGEAWAEVLGQASLRRATAPADGRNCRRHSIGAPCTLYAAC